MGSQRLRSAGFAAAVILSSEGKGLLKNSRSYAIITAETALFGEGKEKA